jgi:hypothetical protein
LGIADLPRGKHIDKIWKSTTINVLVVVQFLILALIYLGMVFDFLFRKLNVNKKITLLLFLMIVYFLIPGMGPEMEARFRIPLLPIMAVISSIGWLLLLNRKEKGMNPPS